jgi:Ankyrin repeats (3 copies)
MLIDHGF